MNLIWMWRCLCWKKALFCFEQGKESGLAQKARAHRMSLLFQQELQQRRTNEDDARMELRSAEIVEQLLCENLLEEARRLLEYAILPRLGAFSRAKLEEKVLHRLL